MAQARIADPDFRRSIAGRLVALNVGLPKDVSWHGRTVHTGVWKYPVDGPRMVRTLNIDGDGQGDLGGHGGPTPGGDGVPARFLRSLAEPSSVANDLEYGQFGENFTVDGLPDDEVCIGDRFRIGEALFEVSQPTGHLLPGGPANGRAPTAGAAGEPSSSRLLPAGAARGRRRRPETRSPGGTDRTGADDGRRDRRLLYLPGHDRAATGQGAPSSAALSPAGRAPSRRCWRRSRRPATSG